MAPIHSRQLLAWTLPTIAALLSYLWYKRKRIGAPSDPGDKEAADRGDTLADLDKDNAKDVSTAQTIAGKLADTAEASPIIAQSSPSRTFSRSLSGVESTPIDIVIPKELRSIKTAPVVISDEDLDFEIEKVKSMKTTNPVELFNKARTANGSPTNKSEFNASRNSDSDSQKSTPESKKSIKIEPVPFECKKTPSKKITSDCSKSAQKKQKTKNKTNMAQKDIAVVEEKLNTLKLHCGNEKENERKKDGERKKKSKSRNSNSGCEREELHRQSSERDSANHSPADVMLASPSLSSISDNHSEGSNDSGKGGSDVATPPPSRTPGTDGSVSGDLKASTVHEFVIPQSLVGKLIGKRGAFVSQINIKANAQILVKRHPTDLKLKVCAVEGTQNEIDRALKMIRDKFPLKKFPEVTLEQVALIHPIPTVPLYSDHLYLKLVAGINNDTIMSCMVNPSHLFLQQPTHPTFPNLNILTNYMNICYSDIDSPLLPSPIPENTVCAAFSVDSWFRAMILSTDAETETSYVKFLDYGGYAYVENSLLRQIRGDFMLLPFQAAECFLANVKPIGESWPEEAYNLMASLTKGSIIYTQVIEYTDEDIPLVHCYAVIGPQQLVFLNQELVNQGFAEWFSYDDQPQQIEAAADAAEPQEIAQQS
ncbi:hypothetical protein HHI36_006849 [Cryptolaemus montrouzieri]|uniref:Tudor domain-containing protein n=1 Tax=Cryptolaemus montrouzieri TaxID=559131 RepID=A0ABD2MN05_9CUCU